MKKRGKKEIMVRAFMSLCDRAKRRVRVGFAYS